MGEFLSVNALGLFTVATLATDYIKGSAMVDDKTLTDNLELIAQAMSPRTNPTANTGSDSGLEAILKNVIGTAKEASQFIFKATFSDTYLPPDRSDNGVVIHFTPTKDTHILQNYITTCFALWGLNTSLAADIATQVQPLALGSLYTPTTTYGRIPTQKIKVEGSFLLAEYICWTAAFAVVQIVSPTIINSEFIIFGFSATSAYIKLNA